MRHLSIFVTLVFCLTALSGCTFLNQAEPSEVMSDFTKALSALDSVHYQAKLSLKGELASQVVEGITDADFVFEGDISDLATLSPKVQINADISANSTGGAVGMAGSLITIDNSTFFQLQKVIVPSLIPLQLNPDPQWYKLDNRNVGLTNASNSISGMESLSADQITIIREMIATSPILEVVESLPIAVVNGERAYHYRLKIATDSLKALLTDIAEITGEEPSLEALDHLATYRPDVFISVRNHQLLQILVNDVYLRAGVPIAFELRISLSRHNAPVGIVAPSSVQPLSSDHLLNLGSLGGF